MIALIVDPLLLGLILWIVARGEARISFLWLFLIAFGASIAAFVAGRITPILSPIAYVLLLPIGLVRFVYVRWKIAWLATALFIGVKAVPVLIRVAWRAFGT